MPRARTNRDSEATQEELSILELTLLRNLKLRMKDKELADWTKVDKKVITEVLDGLFERGYVGKDSKPTEKGFDVLKQPRVPTKEDYLIEVTDLELLLLKNVGRGIKDKRMSELTNVDLETVGQKMDRLYEMGLITENNLLTEKGFDLIHSGSMAEEARASHVRPAAGPTKDGATPGRTVVIQREIVKVPCKYCGTLNELSKATTCSRCGARFP